MGAEGIISLLGALAPVDIRSSRYRVHPFIGWTATPQRHRRQREEVAAVLELPLAASRRAGLDDAGGAPGFRAHGVAVDGAKARMPADLLLRLGDRPAPRSV